MRRRERGRQQIELADLSFQSQNRRVVRGVIVRRFLTGQRRILCEFGDIRGDVVDRVEVVLPLAQFEFLKHLRVIDPEDRLVTGLIRPRNHIQQPFDGRLFVSVLISHLLSVGDCPQTVPRDSVERFDAAFVNDREFAERVQIGLIIFRGWHSSFAEEPAGDQQSQDDGNRTGNRT